MRDLNLKEMMNSKESHLIMKAFSVDVDELGSNGTQKDDVDILISRLNSRKASIYREWREVTNDFDLDKIKRIILGVERDGKVNLIVKQIIKEYKTLVNAKNRGMTFMKEYLKDSETKFELIPFENILDDYLQQRQEIRDAKRIEYYSKPAETGLTTRTENTLLRRSLDEHKATIARQEKRIEELVRVITEHEKAIEGRSKTNTLLRDKLDEQDIELAYTKQQLKKLKDRGNKTNNSSVYLKGLRQALRKNMQSYNKMRNKKKPVYTS